MIAYTRQLIPSYRTENECKQACHLGFALIQEKADYTQMHLSSLPVCLSCNATGDSFSSDLFFQEFLNALLMYFPCLSRLNKL